MRKIESSGNTDRATRLSSRRRQIAAEGLFDDDARMFGQVRGAECRDHLREERGGNGEVMRRAQSAAQRLFDLRERALVVIVPAHVAEQRHQLVQSASIIDPARSLDAVLHAIAQIRQTPLREGDADDRHLEGAPFRHRIECRQYHLVGEIAGHTEEHQCVRLDHCVPLRSWLGESNSRTFRQTFSTVKP